MASRFVDAGSVEDYFGTRKQEHGKRKHSEMLNYYFKTVFGEQERGKKH